MAISLNRIGGRDSRELIVNILKRMITNEIAVQYSLAGKLKKMGFKDLLLAKCIIRAVRLKDDKMTEKEMINYISKWLVQATLRHERSLETKKTKHQETVDADAI
ncbi:e3 ubiquitin-protein ligase protein [Lasius niger]|uniref:E3 ubiquitin-protein ligase protein n=1 Tax=Lasius niger TaxID=67767 RepID=A0A0J7JYK4_LASNI|nr:e3 ubiquitin-protein ligase protein [Lasius niger]